MLYMERESIFLVILIFLLISLTIYEAFCDVRGAMVLGRREGSSEKMTDHIPNQTPMSNEPLDGITLPPLIEYKTTLKSAMIKGLQDMLSSSRNADKAPLLNALKGFGKFYDKAFSRFIFTANSLGNLNPRLVPTKDPIDYDDLNYYLNSHGYNKPVSSLRGIPTAMTFRKNGQFVDKASYNPSSGRMSNPDLRDGGELPLEVPQYNRLREIYTGKPEKFDAMVYTLLFIYHSLGALGNNGSVPIGLLNDEDGVDSKFTELFGSPLNTQSKYGYCSPFTVEVDYFGSFGSFYTYPLIAGNLYTCNPPYIDGMMTDAAKRVVSELRRLASSEGPSTDVFFVFPVWDRKGVEMLGDKKDDANADAPYGCLEVLRASGLVRAEKMLHKNAHKYYSWYGDKLVSYAHTYIFLLSTSETPRIDLDGMIKRWDELIAKKERTGHFGGRLDPDV